MKPSDLNDGPKLLLDRALLSTLPANVAKELSTRGLTTLGKTEKASFVGLMMVDDDSYVFLPRGSDLNLKEDRVVSASNTLKAVQKYGRISKTRIDLLDDGKDKRKLNKLSLIQNLLDDFRQNGIYAKRRIINKLNFGKTDWKKTISNILPYPGLNKAPIYLDTYGVKKRYFNDCEISVIHAYVIAELDKKFSWIVTGNLKPLAPELIIFLAILGARNSFLELKEISEEISPPCCSNSFLKC